MPKDKLRRYAELKNLKNVFEESAPHRGNWARGYFCNDLPIVVELACGKGEYTIDFARRFPNANYIGVDIKGARIWKAARSARDAGLANVAFLRHYIQFLPDCFAPGEISQIWITFPDPFRKNSDANKRLTSPFFLSIYQKVLRAGAAVHLKTDSDLLFNFTLETLASANCSIERRVDDVYKECPDDPTLSIQTYFEKKHLAAGRRIHYVGFRLPEEIIVSKRSSANLKFKGRVGDDGDQQRASGGGAQSEEK